MSGPQLENGFTTIANEIFEALWRTNLYPYEGRVLWYILRKTYGFKKKTDWITLSQFSKAIGLDRRLIHRTLKSLSSKQMIVIYTDDKKHIRYGFQKNYKKWKLNIVISKDDKKSVIFRDDKVSSSEIPTKEIFTKENNIYRGIKFVKPTISEIANYCTSRNNNVDPETFYNHYKSKGWKVGKTPMVDWRAAIITWEKKDEQSTKRYDD